MKKFFYLFAFALIGLGLNAQTVPVTLTVDFGTNTLPAGSTGLHVAGSFSTPAWTPSATPLTQIAGTNKWTAVVQMPQNTTVEYKFVKGNDWPFGDESVSGSCGAGNGNRKLVLTTTGVTVPEVCFGSCFACGVSGPTYNVTFQVDMKGLDAGMLDDTVSVAGAFQGWTPGKSVLTDPNSDGIFAITLPVAADGNYQYKYLNGEAWGKDEHLPCACTVPGTDDRRLVLPALPAGVITRDTILAPVCFTQCASACASANMVGVKFRTNTPGFVGTFTVRVYDNNGRERNIALTGAPEGVLESSVVMMKKGIYDYVYRNGNSDETYAAGLTCVCAGKRELDLNAVPDGAVITLDAYDFQTCTIAAGNGGSIGVQAISKEELGLTISPNPFSDKTTIQFKNENNYNVRISNLAGQTLQAFNNVTGNSLTISRNNMPAGLYFVTFINAEGAVFTQKLVVE